MKRMFALVAILCAVLAGCAYGSSGGDHGNPQPAPSHNSSDCGYSWNPCATADANPKYPLGSNECVIRNVFVGMADSMNVHGTFEVYCKRSPMVILVTARLEFKNSAGSWVDEAPILVSHAIPQPYVAQFHEVGPVACYPGWWRMEIHWSGLKAGGVPFPNPRDGDSPPDRATDPIHLGC